MPKPTQMWDLARIAVEAQSCRDCGAERGDWCVALRELTPRRISQPHASRYPAGDRKIGSPANAAALAERKRKHG